MKKKRVVSLVLTLVMLCTLIPAALAVDIPDDAAEFNGHYYYLYQQSKSWKDAQAFCESKGGHLVTITSAEEQAFLEEYLEGFKDGDYMIGLHRDLDEFQTWVTGEPVSYTNWGTNEPDNLGGQSVGVMTNGERKGSGYHIARGQWDDNRNGSYYFLCEWDAGNPAPVSQPSAQFSPADLLGSWYGQFDTFSDGSPVQMSVEFTVDDCDANGKFSGKSARFEGGNRNGWANFEFEGTFDFVTGAFQLKGTKVTSHNSGSSWNVDVFNGAMQRNAGGTIIAGHLDDDKDRLFSVSRTKKSAPEPESEPEPQQKPIASTPAQFSPSDLLGSWFGQYAGESSSTVVQRYIDFTVNDCDTNGNFSGSAKVTTVAGQGYDHEWVNYNFKGKADFSAGAFHMQGTKITSEDSSSNWSMIPFDGTMQRSASGEVGISGHVDNDNSRLFSVSRTSAWARDEMTEANILGLIPEVLKGKDMSQKISRAEFAAVSVKLYETLTNTTASSGLTPFTDISSSASRNDIGKAYKLGIAVGVSNTKFAPDVQINREQLATMLCRAVKKYRFNGWTIENDADYYMDTSGAVKFADDNSISDFAKPSVYYMSKMGVIEGVDATHFAPKNITPQQEAQGYATATREQAVALSLRIFKISDLLKQP